MEQGGAWEADSRLASQDIPRRDHNSLPLYPVLIQSRPVRRLVF
jgi:hypothetical protein